MHLSQQTVDSSARLPVRRFQNVDYGIRDLQNTVSSVTARRRQHNVFVSPRVAPPPVLTPFSAGNVVVTWLCGSSTGRCYKPQLSHRSDQQLSNGIRKKSSSFNSRMERNVISFSAIREQGCTALTKGNVVAFLSFSLHFGNVCQLARNQNI